MLYNSKGKFFGKISIVDILIIAVITVAVVGAYFRFNGNNVAAEVTTTDFYYTMTISEIRENNKNLLEKSSLNTDFRLAGKIESSMGTLIDVKVEDSTAFVEKTDGTVVVAEVPDKYNLKLAFKVSGTENDSGFFTPELQEICAGKEYTVTNLYCTVAGMVERVWSE